MIYLYIYIYIRVNLVSSFVHLKYQLLLGCEFIKSIPKKGKPAKDFLEYRISPSGQNFTTVSFQKPWKLYIQAPAFYIFFLQQI